MWSRRILVSSPFGTHVSSGSAASIPDTPASKHTARCILYDAHISAPAMRRAERQRYSAAADNVLAKRLPETLPSRMMLLVPPRGNREWMRGSRRPAEGTPGNGQFIRLLSTAYWPFESPLKYSSTPGWSTGSPDSSGTRFCSETYAS